jgi:hypothetical protein
MPVSGSFVFFYRKPASAGKRVKVVVRKFFPQTGGGKRFDATERFNPPAFSLTRSTFTAARSTVCSNRVSRSPSFIIAA